MKLLVYRDLFSNIPIINTYIHISTAYRWTQIHPTLDRNSFKERQLHVHEFTFRLPLDVRYTDLAKNKLSGYLIIIWHVRGHESIRTCTLGHTTTCFICHCSANTDMYVHHKGINRKGLVSAANKVVKGANHDMLPPE